MTADRRHPNVINIQEVDIREMKKGRHDMILRRIGGPAGSKGLGAIHTTVQPGAVSFPFHAHFGTEEAIYVLSGKGTARIGTAKVAVKPGDWIAFPPGEEYAHQMINDGAEPLTYICVSNTVWPDVVVYPDSKKIASAGVDNNSPLGFKRLGMFRQKDMIEDYWDGEPDA